MLCPGSKFRNVLFVIAEHYDTIAEALEPHELARLEVNKGSLH